MSVYLKMRITLKYENNSNNLGINMKNLNVN